MVFQSQFLYSYVCIVIFILQYWATAIQEIQGVVLHLYMKAYPFWQHNNKYISRKYNCYTWIQRLLEDNVPNQKYFNFYLSSFQVNNIELNFKKIPKMVSG